MATTLSVAGGPSLGIYGTEAYGEVAYGGNADLTPYLLHNSLTVKVNTLDFTLYNPPAGIVGLGTEIVLTDPAWSGEVASVMSSDPVDLRNGIEFISVTATNANPLNPDTAPFDLSDVPTSSPLDTYQLEDGSVYELESGTDFAPGNYELEGSLAYGYAGLSVRKSSNPTAGGAPLTSGRVKVYQPGLRPGNIFNLTSLNQGYSASPFEISQVTINWPGLSVNPFYEIEFGDTPQTLALWTQTTAPVSAATAPAVVAPPLTPSALTPSGPIKYGQCSASPGVKAMGGGIVTVGSASFSVSAPAGHSLTCQVQGAIDARMEAWDNYVVAPRRAVRAILSGGIFTGAWQELPFGLARATYDLSSASGIALPSGTYTVSIQIITTEFNQMHVYSGWALVAVTTV